MCVIPYLYPYGPGVEPSLAARGHSLPQDCPPFRHQPLVVPKATCTSDQWATNLEVPLNSLRFNNSLERLTEHRKALSLQLPFYCCVRMQVRRDTWGSVWEGSKPITFVVLRTTVPSWHRDVTEYCQPENSPGLQHPEFFMRLHLVSPMD